jgi:hypothetical protein
VRYVSVVRHRQLDVFLHVLSSFFARVLLTLPLPYCCAQVRRRTLMIPCEIVPGTGEVARFPVETLGTHKDGNTEHNATSTGAPHRHPRQRKPNKATSQYDRRRPDQSCESSSPIKPSRITCKQYQHRGASVRNSPPGCQEGACRHKGGGWGASPNPSVGWQHQALLVGRHRGT